MKKLLLLPIFIIFTLFTGCAPTAPGVLGDIQRGARGAGYVLEDVGRSAERARDGARRTVGAFSNGQLFVPVENWHQTICSIRAYSRGQVVGGVQIAANSFDQLAIGENLVEGRSEVTVTSNCGGIRTVDRIEVDFRERWFRINGGRAEHELLILKPEGRQTRRRVSTRSERYDNQDYQDEQWLERRRQMRQGESSRARPIEIRGRSICDEPNISCESVQPTRRYDAMPTDESFLNPAYEREGTQIACDYVRDRRVGNRGAYQRLRSRLIELGDRYQLPREVSIELARETELSYRHIEPHCR